MVTVSTQQRNKIHPHKFTMWVAIGSILMMFAGLTSAYIVKSNQAAWQDVRMPKAFWASTVAILLSSVTMQLAVRAFRQRSFSRYRSLLVATLALGIVFIALQVVGFGNLAAQMGIDLGWGHANFRGQSGAGAFVIAIAGLHAVHVLGGVIALMVVFAKAFVGRSKNYNTVPVEVMATYWHFVDILWLYLLVFFMWIG